MAQTAAYRTVAAAPPEAETRTLLARSYPGLAVGLVVVARVVAAAALVVWRSLGRAAGYSRAWQYLDGAVAER